MQTLGSDLLRRWAACTIAAVLLFLTAAQVRGDDWPQWMGPGRDGVWHEQGILNKFPDGNAKIVWRAKIGSGYAGPAVAGGRVYLADYITAGNIKGAPDKRAHLTGKERVVCFDAKNGDLIWKYEYPCAYDLSFPGGPRCTPTIEGGRVYALGAMGALHCLDAHTGAMIWSRDLKKDYSVKTPPWGFCGHPLVDGRKLICLVGGPGSVAVALDKETGKEVWRALTAPEPGYCPPTLIEAGGTRQLIIWHVASINSLDPETGKAYWSVSLKPAHGEAIAAPRPFGDTLYVSGKTREAILLKLAADQPAASVAWRGQKTTAVYCCNSTPFLEDGSIYGVDYSGTLRAVNLADGQRIWETLAPFRGKRLTDATAFLVKNGERFFLFIETGELIIARLSRQGYEEISRCQLLEPTSNAWGRSVVWSYPAFANRCVFARNDRELVCASLAADGPGQ